MSIVVAGLLAIVVGATIVKAARPESKRVVHADVASDLQPFFTDPAVQREIAHKRFTLVADGGRDLTVSDQPGEGVTVFSTPLVAVASPNDASLLMAIGVAHKDASGQWTIDPAKLMSAIDAHQVAVRSGGPRSTAGGYFAALLADVANNRRAPVDATTVVNAVSPAFTSPPATTGVPVVAVMFEADARPNGSVVMYPNPDVVANAVVDPHTPAGTDFAKFLSTDATLQKAAAAMGYRSATTKSESVVAVNTVPAPQPAVFSQLQNLLTMAAQARAQ